SWALYSVLLKHWRSDLSVTARLTSMAFAGESGMLTVQTYAQGVIEDSIYRAASQSDIPDAALAEYIRVMGFSVDFQREVRGGYLGAMRIPPSKRIVSPFR
ncbi:MAG: hypothetical protein VW867_10950, partial [Gammaproteobacteria bacterium]